MPRMGFEPTIAAGERPQTYALDRAALHITYDYKYINRSHISLINYSERSLNFCVQNNEVRPC